MVELEVHIDGLPMLDPETGHLNFGIHDWELSTIQTGDQWGLGGLAVGLLSQGFSHRYRRSNAVAIAAIWTDPCKTRRKRVETQKPPHKSTCSRPG
jgi:hypothetical protein